jgi:hypothetical protein
MRVPPLASPPPPSPPPPCAPPPPGSNSCSAAPSSSPLPSHPFLPSWAPGLVARLGSEARAGQWQTGQTTRNIHPPSRRCFHYHRLTRGVPALRPLSLQRGALCVPVFGTCDFGRIVQPAPLARCSPLSCAIYWQSSSHNRDTTPRTRTSPRHLSPLPPTCYYRFAILTCPLPLSSSSSILSSQAQSVIFTVHSQ